MIIIELLTVYILSSATFLFYKVFSICSCKLTESTLYYALLLPMGVIIVHNVVIFIMVMRCLVQGNTVVSPGWYIIRVLQS